MNNITNIMAQGNMRTALRLHEILLRGSALVAQ
jgi:hypothetical protein